MGFFALLKKPRAPDPCVFHTFYQETLRPLSRHLQALGLRKVEELEDVLQNTYLEAHKSFGNLQDPQAALAWLMTIGRRQYYHYLSQQARHRKIFTESGHREEDVASHAFDPSTRSADETFHATALCHKIARKIDGITNLKKRQVIRMFFLEEHSLKEIAVATAINVSTLTTWISRFRKDVGQLLSEERAPAPEAADMILAIQEVFP